MMILLNFTCIWIICIYLYIYDTLNCSILLNKFVYTRLLSELIYLIFVNYTHERPFMIICPIFWLLDVIVPEILYFYYKVVETNVPVG